jgi:ribonuclease VapC
MVLDTSALLAILLGEPESEAMVRAIAGDNSRLVGAATVVEASAVMQARKGAGGDVALDALLRRLSMETVPLTPPAASLARLAYGRFGKGVGSPGVLNYGDCLSYGVAMSLGEPLLFKGEDFSQTDVTAVEYR